MCSVMKTEKHCLRRVRHLPCTRRAIVPPFSEARSVRRKSLSQWPLVTLVGYAAKNCAAGEALYLCELAICGTDRKYGFCCVYLHNCACVTSKKNVTAIATFSTKDAGARQVGINVLFFDCID